MQKEKQHKKEKKKKKKGNKEKTSLVSLYTNKNTTTEKKGWERNKTKKPIKQVAAFVTLCTTCIGTEEGSRGGGS